MNKSKFTVFILSILPGLSHLYLGLTNRALIFFLLFFGTIVAGSGILIITNGEEFFYVVFMALPVIWFVALVDAMSIVDKMRMVEANGEINNINPEQVEGIAMNNRKIITVVLSLIPGAGHMYLGYLKQGIQLMSIFFFSIFLMGWLNLSLFLFIVPVIWFYSIFDAFHRVEEEITQQKAEELSVITWLNSNPHWIGWGLIILGCLVIIGKLVSPMLTWEMRNYLQTGIVALILIAGGIKLLTGTKLEDTSQTSETETKGGVEECDNGE